MKLIISDVVISSLPYVKLEISKDFNTKAWDLIKSSLKRTCQSHVVAHHENFVRFSNFMIFLTFDLSIQSY